MGKRKYVITLSGVFAHTVLNEHIETVINDKILSKSDNEFDITDLTHERDRIGRKALYFFDSKKKRIKLWPVMIDSTQNGPLPLYTTKPCRNCHHSFITHPIGCPIRYNPNITDITDDHRKRIIDFLIKNNFPTDTNDFFDTEHMFCSWPCVKSYILSRLSANPHSHVYKNALSYMTLMHRKIHGKDVPIIIPKAHPLETLEDYGGWMTIEEWRASLGVLKYDETLNVQRPYMYSCSAYIQETRIDL